MKKLVFALVLLSAGVSIMALLFLVRVISRIIQSF